MSKDLDISQLTTKGKEAAVKLQRYSGFIFILSVLFMYTFLVYRISVLSQTEPSEEAIAEQSQAVKQLKIDQTSLDKIQQLRDQNVAVDSIFKDARNNPFQD